ncbi:MAG TPA: hypothetical protein VN729_01430 [Ktedonobacteraceae bacterium]|nr:hypothetical protein [Ktedonobacteraceae bacterium]
MSQQEFEPRGQQPDEEVYRPHYPYNWSGQREEGMPRDELPGAYDAPASQAGRVGSQDYQARQAQVPWWARPQPRQYNRSGFIVLIFIVALIVLLMGGLGIVGVVLGSLLHVLGVLLGALFALFIFVVLLLLLVFVMIRRAIGRTFGLSSADDRRARRSRRRGSWY